MYAELKGKLEKTTIKQNKTNKTNNNNKTRTKETVWVLLNALTLKTWHKVFAEYRFWMGPRGGRRDWRGLPVPPGTDAGQLCAALRGDT